MKQKMAPFGIILTVLFLGCIPLLGGGNYDVKDIQQATYKQLRNAAFRGASWSIMAVDLQTGQILTKLDENRALIPASGIKLIVSACALETLGPDFCTSTAIGYTGQITWEGTIAGDLVVLGAGDPTIASRFYQQRVPTEPSGLQSRFVSWADSLKRRGIQRIEGSLVGYTGLFKGDPLGHGWEWDDLPGWWAAELSNLIYADNCVEVSITPGDSIGQPATISYNPSNAPVQIQNAILTCDSSDHTEFYYDRVLFKNHITLWGAISQQSAPQSRRISIHDPAAYFLGNLQEDLQRQGIQINAAPRTSSSWVQNDSNFHLLFTDPSPPLSSLLPIINQQSHNLYSEILIRLMGRQILSQEVSDDSLSAEAFLAGRDYVLDWNARLPGFSSALSLADGCGLSRRNLASASEFIKVLAQMRRSTYRDLFINSLAQPGIGTLQNRFLGLPRGVKLYAKSGSMSRVRSLSGYLSLGDQPQIAFSVICNNYFCSSEEIDQAMENILQNLALHLKAGQSKY